MEALYLPLGIAMAIWLLTSKKFRKTIGDDSTESLTIVSTSMKQSLRISQLNTVLDFEEELSERGKTPQQAKKSLDDFDAIFTKGVKDV